MTSPQSGPEAPKDSDLSGAGEPQTGPAGRQPIFNGLPTVILTLALLMVGVSLLDEVTLSQGHGLVHGLIYWLATIRTGEAAVMGPPTPLGGLPPYILHVFVHFGWMHLVMNVGALLAFGAAARTPFGAGWRADASFLAFFFACAIGGALLHGLIHANETSTMAGASTAISGLVAAAGWARGGRALMLRLAVPWLGLNLLIAVLDPFMPIGIAWAGHVGGLLVGMVAYPAFVRWARSGQVSS